MQIKSWINILLVTLSVTNTNIFAASTYYRYVDKNGQKVMSNTIPTEAVSQGYEIVSPRGNVIQTVPPVPTAEELAKDKALQEQQRQILEQEEQKKRQEAIQAKKDKILLESFSSEADITRSRDEKIASIRVLEQIIHENLTRLQKQLDDANLQATKYTQSNQPIPENVEKTIADTKRQMNADMNFLNRKKTEIEEIHTKYQGLIERFRQLDPKNQNK